MSESELKQLLTDMRMQVVWTHVATMPIPLYERMKEALQAKDPKKETLIEIIKDLLNIFPAEYAALTAAKGTIQEAEAALKSARGID